MAACPGWSTFDLVVHLGNVHAWAATIVETGQWAAEHNDEPRSNRPRAVSEWYSAKAEDLYEVLRQAEPERSCWNFALDGGTVAFWSRRQLHETTVHLLDLDLACGRTPAVDPAVAADGVAEVLDVLVHRHAQRGATTPRSWSRSRSAATDTGDTWVLTPTGAVPTVRRGDARGVRDRVEAPAEVLYRLLWHREADESAVRPAATRTGCGPIWAPA